MSAEEKPKFSGQLDSESILNQLGQTGRFHLCIFVLMGIVCIQVAQLHTTYIFLAAGVPYR